MNAHQKMDGEDFTVADSWGTSVTDSLERSRRTAWIVAGVASTIALLLAIAIVVMMPLKSVEPYTLLVDRQTGHVEALAPLDEAVVTPDSALTRAFLAQYVIARESYDRATLQTSYRKAMLFSAGEERRRYAALMNSSNPASPLAQLLPGTALETEVKSVSSLSNGSALVRFVTVPSDRSGRTGEPSHWAAVINFTYSGASMSADDRLINPLGFQVTRYRRDQETLTTGGTPALPRVTEAGTGK